MSAPWTPGRHAAARALAGHYAGRSDERGRLCGHLADAIDHIEALQAKCDRQQAALKLVEWRRIDGWDDRFCPACGENELRGHATGCELAEALTKEGD